MVELLHGCVFYIMDTEKRERASHFTLFLFRFIISFTKLLRVPGCFGTHKWNLAELLVNREGGSRSRTVLRPPAQTRLKAGKHWGEHITLGEVTSIGERITFS